MRESAAILGVRELYFLDQRDHRYTTDVDEVLGEGAHVWDLAYVRARLHEILERGRYDFVVGLAPTPDTHAHHKAATALATEAVLAEPAGARPVVLVAQTRSDENASGLAYAPEETGVPIGPFVFDRRQKFGFQDALDYRIVVNWSIAAHKSQGTLQVGMNQGSREEFFLFGLRDLESSRKAAELFEKLRGKQFESKTYGASAGTNAVSQR
jgi:LmbE family N-acetylglucosaminyl deacetylase